MTRPHLDPARQTWMQAPETGVSPAFWGSFVTVFAEKR